MLGKSFSRRHIEFFFPWKIGFDILCKGDTLLKVSDLSRKNQKNISLLSVEFAHRLALYICWKTPFLLAMVYNYLEEKKTHAKLITSEDIFCVQPKTYELLSD